jgi:hypothetical protein
VGQLGAGSRTEAVEALTEFALDVLQVHGGSDASIRHPRGGLRGHTLTRVARECGLPRSTRRQMCHARYVDGEDDWPVVEIWEVPGGLTFDSIGARLEDLGYRPRAEIPAAGLGAAG